jgi:hypothetical protein
MHQRKVRVNIGGPMEIDILENGGIICWMGKVYLSGMMIGCILVTGKIIWCMEKALTDGKMKECFKDRTKIWKTRI